jgi:NTE family protein
MPTPRKKSTRDSRGFEQTALVLQGGGALGAYQGGAFEGLHEAGIAIDWVAGISIGAINAALIAGNPPPTRLARLKEFWELVSDPTPAWPMFQAIPFEFKMRELQNFASASIALTQGQHGFFTPRVPPPWLQAPGSAGATSYYDTAPLRDTLRRLVDFDRINAGPMRLSVSAVNIETGNFRTFDSASEAVTVDHIMASAALPPAFAPVHIPGEGYFWDGGLVSNAPIEYVLDFEPRRDTLCFQVDLWSALGPMPRDLLDVLERQKDIQFSSRTRRGTDRIERRQTLRHHVDRMLSKLPQAARLDPSMKALEAFACDRVANVVHLIYQAKAFEGHAKDFEFSRLAMQEHWAAGLTDLQATLKLPKVLARPEADRVVVTHDVHRPGSSSH